MLFLQEQNYTHPRFYRRKLLSKRASCKTSIAFIFDIVVIRGLVGRMFVFVCLYGGCQMNCALAMVVLKRCFSISTCFLTLFLIVFTPRKDFFVHTDIRKIHHAAHLESRNTYVLITNISRHG